MARKIKTKTMPNSFVHTSKTLHSTSEILKLKKKSENKSTCVEKLTLEKLGS